MGIEIKSDLWSRCRGCIGTGCIGGEEDFWDESESDLVRDSSSDESSSDKEEEKIDVNNRCEEKHEETGITKPALSVFHSGLGDYLCTVRETGSLLTKKCERHRIRELEKAASNSQSIKTMFATEQLCTYILEG